MVFKSNFSVSILALPFSYYVYMLASKKNGVLYIGVTNNLLRRIYEHKNKKHKGFTEKYFTNKLVYFEETDSIFSAIAREKQFKKWNRQWKINLIQEMNPDWNDLNYEYGGFEFDIAMKELESVSN